MGSYFERVWQHAKFLFVSFFVLVQRIFHLPLPLSDSLHHHHQRSHTKACILRSTLHAQAISTRETIWRTTEHHFGSFKQLNPSWLWRRLPVITNLCAVGDYFQIWSLHEFLYLFRLVELLYGSILASLLLIPARLVMEVVVALVDFLGGHALWRVSVATLTVMPSLICY